MSNLSKELYELKLGETLHDFDTPRVSAQRVPGGWIFTYFYETTSSVFVPFNNEFMEE